MTGIEDARLVGRPGTSAAAAESTREVVLAAERKRCLWGLCTPNWFIDAKYLFGIG